MDDAVFPLNLMCSLRNQLSRWLLAHYELDTIAPCDLVCRIRLPKAKLSSLEASRAEDGGQKYLL